ncbi:Clavaminate synthase-like protein [Fomitiporia mediterranea MF3/22]|uniref:Clavaminate synthase-like protein n=1 Tax=Fomitiporia mediterranea (strain MF3/22) TaxID=694068 RepID=UPI0004408E6A|nr:Clavaminate synthase-like protein [Fomitiporia mediterranea MF3/22]EJD04538.1 Clavaminate synthase-like protein [Fomitiporia mediterranea MF3/22]
MPGLELPPFPDDIPTHPLLVVDFELIKGGDVQEIDKLWKAATELGFWYLKNHNADNEAEAMFEMGAETMDLPLDEKMKYEQGDGGSSFGYKAAGANATDEYGNLDTVEFINVSKDDVLAYPRVVHRTYPSTVNNRMESTIRPFVEKSLHVNNTVLSVFEKKLGLPSGTLLELHSREEPSGSEARCIKNPPKQPGIDSTNNAKETSAIGAHTDFGSLSFLHNRLGGLQVLPPNNPDWQYVRPIPGHAICNIGDALTLFSGGILRSNLHRVVPPPGAQAAYPRWSLVFFTRPGGNVQLRALVDKSGTIRDVVSRMSDEQRAKYEPNTTAIEWFARRIRNQRIKNRAVSIFLFVPIEVILMIRYQGPETWRASRGMEHKPEVV